MKTRGMSALLGLMLLAGSIGAAGAATDEGLILWNKLGSEYEVANSEVGPALSWYGSTTPQFNVEQGDSGVYWWAPDYTVDHGYYPILPAGTLPLGNKGCIELWVRPNFDKSEVKTGNLDHTMFFAQMGAPYSASLPAINVYQHPNSVPKGNITLWYNNGTGTPSYYIDAPTFDYSAGELFHVAAVWDADGIDGTADNLRLYINGVLHSSKTGVAVAGPINAGGSIIGRNIPPNPPHSMHGTLHDIKIWDFAKTDFSDSLDEDGDGVLAFDDACPGSTEDEFEFIQTVQENRGCGPELVCEGQGAKDSDQDGFDDDADLCPWTDGSRQPHEPVIDGCACYQILQFKPGVQESELKEGCSEDTVGAFSDRTGWAKELPRPPQ